MARKRKEAVDGFNLAFLDVMACGLGAVILIFMLVDFKDVTVDTTEEKERLESELKASQTEQKELQKSLEEVNDNIAMESSKDDDNKRKQQEIQADLDDTMKAIATQQAVLADLDKQKAAVAEKLTKANPVQKAGTGEQNYIVGMPVEGKSIGILIDKSSSMMDTELVDILLATTLPDNMKVSQPKWVRTKNIATWLLSRLPQGSRVTVVVFSDDAKLLGSRNAISPSSTQLLNEVKVELGSVIPSGGTDLRLGIDTLMKANSSIDSVYLVTDGLPTLGERLTSTQCVSLTKRKTISAECRRQLGNKTLNYFRTQYRGTKLSTILLPLEGDPFASSVFWDTTWATGGKMLSPALEWN